MEIVVKEFATEIRDVDSAKRQLTMAISTEGVDRRGDIVETAGFDLRAYKKNPVVLFAHNYAGLSVGKSVKIWTEDDKLMSRTEFAPTPLGMELWTLYSLGYMRAASVGFRVIAKERIEKKGNPESGNEMDIWPSFRYKRQELLEYSLVAVPADPDSLAVAKQQGIVTVSELEQVMRKLGNDLEERPYPNEHACRLRSPDDFQDGSFRRMKRKHESKEYSVILGRLKGEDTMTEQAYRYAKTIWDASSARSHCKSHDGSFEAASEEEETEALLFAAMFDTIKLLEGGTALPDNLKSLAVELCDLLESALEKRGESIEDLTVRTVESVAEAVASKLRLGR